VSARHINQITAELERRLRDREEERDKANYQRLVAEELLDKLEVKLAAAEAERDLARAAEDTSSIVRQSIEAQVRSLTAKNDQLENKILSEMEMKIASLSVDNGQLREQSLTAERDRYMDALEQALEVTHDPTIEKILMAALAGKEATNELP